MDIDTIKLAQTMKAEYCLLLHSIRPVQNARDCYAMIVKAIACELKLQDNSFQCDRFLEIAGVKLP